MTFLKTITVKNFTVNFRIDIRVYFDDYETMTELMFLSTYCNNNSKLMNCYELYNKTMTLTDEGVHNIKRYIQEMEEKSIDLINGRLSIEERIDKICHELSYITKT